MPEAIIITPVKDSLETTRLTIEAISKAKSDFDYFVFNDFSKTETKQFLESQQSKSNFQLINLDEITDSPSPNYKLVLKMAQKMAIEKNCPLIIIESDVIIKPDTIKGLMDVYDNKTDAGMIGAITVDKMGNYNFPYTFEINKTNEITSTSHSLSFCCTLISPKFLALYDFGKLSQKKDWYDVTISRQSKKLGFNNYLAKGIEVTHLPHSSRPWKNLKYSNPLLYYIKKYFYKRDRI